VAGYVPLEIEQYSNFSRIITIKDSAGVAQNLSGYSANTLMKKSFYSSQSNTITTTISDASNGEITLSMTSANSSGLTPGRYWYDLTTTTPGGIVQRVIEGIVVVSPGVTH
jgi:hypothetical protein